MPCTDVEVLLPSTLSPTQLSSWQARLSKLQSGAMSNTHTEPCCPHSSSYTAGQQAGAAVTAAEWGGAGVSSGAGGGGQGAEPSDGGLEEAQGHLQEHLVSSGGWFKVLGHVLRIGRQWRAKRSKGPTSGTFAELLLLDKAWLEMPGHVLCIGGLGERSASIDAR